MDWVRENWFWIVVGILFIWAHTKMHGGHGHGGHGSAAEHGGHSGGCGGGTSEEQNEARG